MQSTEMVLLSEIYFSQHRPAGQAYLINNGLRHSCHSAISSIASQVIGIIKHC